MALDKWEFAPLSLPSNSLPEDLQKIYKVVDVSGEVTTVEAGSASEAVERSGVSKPLKVINAAYERKLMLEKNLLNPNQGNVLTNIDLTNNASDMRFLVVDDLGDDEPEQPFEEMSLYDMSGTAPAPAASLDEVMVDVPAEAEVPPVPESAQTEEVAPEPVAEEAAPEPAAEEAAASEPAQEPDRELTPEEVRRLLNDGDDAAPVDSE